MGPVVSAVHRDKVLEFYDIAKKEGANVILGGGAPKMEGDLANGFFVEPTIWTGLSEDATVLKEEISRINSRRGSLLFSRFGFLADFIFMKELFSTG